MLIILFLYKRSNIIRKDNEEMVIDPNESWSDFFKSMVNLDQPKVVPLSKLPKGYDPTKRRFNKLKTIHWLF